MSTVCSSRFFVGLCFLVLFHGSLAQLPGRLSGRSECQIEQITAREPNRRQVSEAGFSEFWDSGENEELDCAGVQVVRHTINPKGLLLPCYPNTHELVYVVRGEGLQGTVLPGCAETSEGGTDKHQRVYRYREGDILALPAGAVHWTYNHADKPVVLVALRDTSNVANQLDRNFRKFFLAGNPQSQMPQGKGHQGKQQQRPSWSEPKEHEGFNMYAGFDDGILQQVFDVEYEIVSQLKGFNDDRGLIVLAEYLHVLVPEEGEERRRDDNWIEQTICSTQLSANIGSPVGADVYNPRGGRISRLNSHKLPVLESLQLSAERGVLYKNAVLAPHYNLNAHSIIYITSGNSRLQIVGNDGSAVFDGEVQEGQLIVVPQDFAVIKKAGEEGCEWVAFKTNDNAITMQLAGRFSYIRALPEDVLVNSYNISPEEARNLKYNRKEGVVLSPRSRSPLKEAQNALLNTLFG
ncbi:hypothetical protein R6Q59_002941 [Mikania micrantha]|uniref:Cupin type-1 domain-containing protein n=1 Tax=Mikania micrantha TaxID=192012 RepID=A0A5N6MJK9_9ASTR|nr:hypothetical protein E3N88_29402 [Mikania micrantha]